jgi:uncharacterized membrane protein YozB (DUF420 family)
MATALRRSERLLFTLIAVSVTLLVLAGFAPTYYLKPWFNGPALTPLVHAHGLVFSAWVVLFATQVTLVSKGQVHLHRRLGIAGAVLALAMLAFGLLTAVVSAQLGHTPDASIPPLAFFAIPVCNILTFALLVGAALQLRREPQSHKRLMTLATITVTTPAIARLPFEFIQIGGPLAFYALTNVLVIACMAWDAATRGKVHSAWWRGGLLILVSQIGSLLLARSEAWVAFAAFVTA